MFELIWQKNKCSKPSWVTYDQVAEKVAVATGEKPIAPAGSLAKLQAIPAAFTKRNVSSLHV